jgi:hypothetical protein
MTGGSCEHGNEPSDLIECGEFSSLAERLLASQEELCSMELVALIVNQLVSRRAGGVTPQLAVGE